MEDAESTATMLQEMGTVGVGMALALTAIWGVGLLLYRVLRNRKSLKKVVKE